MSRGLVANSIRWDGLEALRAALRKLPADLASEAEGIVLGAAEAAAAEIEAAYPYGPAGRTRKGRPIEPGNLKAGMFVMRSAASRFGVGAVVINRAKHAWIFEHGSEARHYYTVNGVEKSVGRMPPRPTFIPRARRHRRHMYVRLADLLERHGLEVTGFAA